MASKLEVDVVLKSSVNKFWGGITASAELFPKVFPEQYKSIEVLEGDGNSVGTIRLIKFSEGMPIVKFSKEKIEVADEANKLVTYSVIEGDILSYYKTFRATLQVIPKEDGSLVKWSVLYDKASEEVPEPEFVKETAIRTFKGLDEHLLKN
ncbi:putative Bet v I/Major latex protein [Dioscorea sansibarensis]